MDDSEFVVVDDEQNYPPELKSVNEIIQAYGAARGTNSNWAHIF